MTRGLSVGAVGLVLVALGALLGSQGARAGPFTFPELSPWWVVAAVAAVFALTPRRAGRDIRPPRAAALWGLGFLVSFFLLVLLRNHALHARASLEAFVDGEREARTSPLQIERRNELRRVTGKRRMVTLAIDAVLEVPRAGRYRLDLYCDDSCDVVLGSHAVRVEGGRTEELTLERVELPLSIRYHQEAGPAALVLRWDTPGWIELLPIDYYVRPPGAEKRDRSLAHATLFAFVLWWAGFSIYLVRVSQIRSRWVRSPFVPAACALLLIVYGTVLRFEALLAHSRLAESEPYLSMHEALLPWLPAYGIFNPDNAPEDPYRADVRSYLDRAESMTLAEFYAPSFREPFYVLISRGFVKLFRGDFGILVQSFFFSALTLPLFWLVARRIHGDLWAAALLVPVSLHEWLVLEAPTGYRMSAYSFVLVGVVGFFASSPSSPTWPALAGVLSGLLSLIRLSALSVATPLLAIRLIAIDKGKRLRYGGGFALALFLLVGPFLLSNFRAHGDPFYSISFHTEFWLRAEGLDEGQGPVSWTRYFTDFGRIGSVAKGTLLGLTVLPLRTFWNGLRAFSVLGVATLALGTAGLGMIGKEPNRYLAAAYFGHLLPFAYIQNFPSGEMPRFVMPAYFLLALAVPAGWETLRAVWNRARNR